MSLQKWKCDSFNPGLSFLTFFFSYDCSAIYRELTCSVNAYTSSFARISICIWAPSSEFVSSSIPSWQISTAHVQPFRGARDLVFCLKVPPDSLLVWASTEGSGETARMRRLAWTFAARIGDKYQIRLTRPIWSVNINERNNLQSRRFIAPVKFVLAEWIIVEPPFYFSWIPQTCIQTSSFSEEDARSVR